MPQNNAQKRVNDPLLTDFLIARNKLDEELALCALVAQPLNGVRNELKKRVKSDDVFDELMSDVIFEMLERLNTCKEEYRLFDCSYDLAIENFSAYAWNVMLSVFTEYIRKKYPIRTNAQRRLLDFLQKDLAEPRVQPRFAVWNLKKLKLCGFYSWIGQSRQETPNYLLALQNPHDIATLAFKPGSGVATMKMRPLLAGLFSWIDTPLDIRDAVYFIMYLLGLTDYQSVNEQSLEDSEGETTNVLHSIASSDRNPEERFLYEGEKQKIRDSFQPIWQTILDLKPNHRKAFLLNPADRLKQGQLLPILLRNKIATFDQIAQALDMTPGELQKIWNVLPLCDRDIGKLVGQARGKDYPDSTVSVWRGRAVEELSEKFDQIFRNDVG